LALLSFKASSTLAAGHRQPPPPVPLWKIKNCWLCRLESHSQVRTGLLDTRPSRFTSSTVAIPGLLSPSCLSQPTSWKVTYLLKIPNQCPQGSLQLITRTPQPLSTESNRSPTAGTKQNCPYLPHRPSVAHLSTLSVRSEMGLTGLNPGVCRADSLGGHGGRQASCLPILEAPPPWVPAASLCLPSHGAASFSL
jgi:hypothetical protein